MLPKEAKARIRISISINNQKDQGPHSEGLGGGGRVK